MPTKIRTQKIGCAIASLAVVSAIAARRVVVQRGAARRKRSEKRVTVGTGFVAGDPNRSGDACGRLDDDLVTDRHVAEATLARVLSGIYYLSRMNGQ